MNNPKRSLMARAGFTLIEVLVTLVLVGLLVGVIVPAVLNQLGSGEPTRIAADLEGVRSGVRLFRVDVKRFPGTPEQLLANPTVWEDSTDYSGTAIPGGLIDRWGGPYLETGSFVDGGASAVDTLLIGLGGQADASFGDTTWTGNTWLRLGFTGYTIDQTREVSEVIDGDTAVTAGDSGGRVRWDASGSRLVYYIVPIN